LPIPADSGRFDPADPRLSADPAAFWDHVTRGPDRLAAGRNAVAFWRHATVLAILEDRDGTRKCPDRLLSAFPPGPFRDHNAATMTFLDPPGHAPVRRRFARAFAPRMLEALQPVIEGASRDLLAALRARRRADIAVDYAARLPLRVIAAILGLAVSEEDMLAAAAHAIVSGLEPGADAATLAAADRAVEALAARLAPQLEQPQHGGLFAALADGQDPLPPDCLLHNAIFLLNAGHETTSRLIAGLARTLLLDPALAGQVRGNEDLAAGLVEEMLRLDPPLQFVPRVLVRPRDGIPADSLVFLLIAAANRDPAMFDDPGRLDPTRKAVRAHLSFAAGTHLCLGATLARLEGRIAALHLAEIVPGWRSMPGASRATGRMFQGWSRIPVEVRA
jgi:hypothetical protein